MTIRTYKFFFSYSFALFFSFMFLYQGNPNPFEKPKLVTQSSDYTGSHNGKWEGYLLNQYNSGSAQFSVQTNGKATLRLLGGFSATHKGRVEGKYFIIDKGERCSIVDLGGRRFRINLRWAGVNVDVNFG